MVQVDDDSCFDMIVVEMNLLDAGGCGGSFGCGDSHVG